MSAVKLSDWPFRVEVKPRAPLPELSDRENSWGLPCPKEEAVGEYLFATYGDAFQAARKGSQFWACIRLYDAQKKRALAAWRDGKRVSA